MTEFFSSPHPLAGRGRAGGLGLAGLAFGPTGRGPRLRLERLEVSAADVPVAPAELMPGQVAGLDQLAQPLRRHVHFTRGLTQEHEFILHARMIPGRYPNSSTASACRIPNDCCILLENGKSLEVGRVPRKPRTAEQREKRRTSDAAYSAKNRERIAAYGAAWYAAHPRQFTPEERARAAATAAAWRAANPEREAANKAAYYQAHRDEVLAKNAAYRAAHRDEVLAATRAWYAANRARVLAQKSAYTAAHREQVAAASARHRARKLGACVSDLTRAQWDSIKATFGQRCAYCGEKPKRLTQDHLIPLSKGGDHTAANVVPACKPCNSRKAVGPPLVPVQPVLLA